MVLKTRTGYLEFIFSSQYFMGSIYRNLEKYYFYLKINKKKDIDEANTSKYS